MTSEKRRKITNAPAAGSGAAPAAGGLADARAAGERNFDAIDAAVARALSKDSALLLAQTLNEGGE